MAVEQSLQDLADLIGAELRGDGDCLISKLEPLDSATKGAITFLTSSKYQSKLLGTKASAVILKKEDAESCPANCLVIDNPYLGYAKIAQALYPDNVLFGIAASAVIAESVLIDNICFIGANAVVGENTVLGEGVVVGAGCVIGDNVKIGKGSRIHANVTVYDHSIIGEHALILSGAVIGSDGFGLASDAGKWLRIPQLGRVILGNDVEVGANTTIDRGALEDTVIADGVKLDNQIQIAHNVRIGENTAIAACTGIAGSTTIGKNCTIAGAVGMNGHLEIADNVHITGKSMVTKSVKEAGVYSSGVPLQTNRDWHKSAIRFRQLDDMAKRLKKLEKIAQDQTKD
jgi:UDP-3-O-[3-hydroxymyristoyl] glucosamine N-acyltransferase